MAANDSTNPARDNWFKSVAQFMAETRAAEGVDYAADQDLNGLLDFAVRRLATNPENARRGARWFFDTAHRQVMTLRAA